MTDAFIDAVLATLEGSMDGLGRYARDLAVTGAGAGAAKGG